MSVQQRQAGETSRANQAAMRFVSSKMFSNIFGEGMKLVEETAGYLDGEGRDAARDLDRTEALSYAGISMRLTTRLMQIASWLLVMRAVREDEMSYEEASQDKYRLGSPEPTDRRKSEIQSGKELAGLPAELVRLRGETAKLYERIVRIDGELFDQPPLAPAQYDAASRIEALNRAFPGTRDE
ncbi:DUF1465 family protein [Aquisalinus flavus]|uniref:Regulator of CtrA degradation rcdA n=1 Tax=Aquisalinus flavus TaxID=1526572 RepID=A0A8J2V216_9PROT|nr:DUF1465 family protein [Aquisalinus flavus]GGC97493.1 hypothetical protein GCM10011342_03020 [Aquisalinus flavus]